MRWQASSHYCNRHRAVHVSTVETNKKEKKTEAYDGRIYHSKRKFQLLYLSCAKTALQKLVVLRMHVPRINIECVREVFFLRFCLELFFFFSVLLFFSVCICLLCAPVIIFCERALDFILLVFRSSRSTILHSALCAHIWCACVLVFGFGNRISFLYLLFIESIAV